MDNSKTNYVKVKTLTVVYYYAILDTDNLLYFQIWKRKARF